MLDYLLAFEILQEDPLEMAIESARLDRALGKQGRQIRKGNDSLIACYALNRGIKILHQDRDFDKIMGTWGTREQLSI